MFVQLRLQLIASLLLLVLAVLINTRAFPVKNIFIVLGVVVLLAIVFYFFLSNHYSAMQKAITVSVSSIALFFFLLTTNFYPQLLAYQGGKPLADLTKEKISPKDVYFWKNTYSSSYNFYSASLRQVYNDSLLYGNKKTWIIYFSKPVARTGSCGYSFKQ